MPLIWRRWLLVIRLNQCGCIFNITVGFNIFDIIHYLATCFLHPNSFLWSNIRGIWFTFTTLLLLMVSCYNIWNTCEPLTILIHARRWSELIISRSSNIFNLKFRLTREFSFPISWILLLNIWLAEWIWFNNLLHWKRNQGCNLCLIRWLKGLQICIIAIHLVRVFIVRSKKFSFCSKMTSPSTIIWRFIVIFQWLVLHKFILMTRWLYCLSI